jgi:hypothetical protein
VDSVLETQGSFSNLRVQHSKSKRGPALSGFRVIPEGTGQALILRLEDPQEREQAESHEIEKLVVETLSDGPMNQTQLLEAGKAHEYGRERLVSAVKALVQANTIIVERGQKNSKVFRLNATLTN